MGIYGMMRTGVSGMNAQTNRLSGIADNVSNSSTVGYKRTDTQFSSLVLPSGPTSYQSGSVNTHVRHDMTAQGPSRSTLRSGDALINGNGFYRVADESGAEYMTRAGSFVRDGEGYLRNAAGFYLLDPTGERIQIKGGPTELFGPEQTTKVDMAMNLSASATVVDRGSTSFSVDNPASYSQKKSMDVYDQQGSKISLDMYYTKTVNGDSTANPPTEDTWELTIPGANPETTTMTFDADGNLTSPIDNPTITLAGANNTNFGITLNFSAEDGSKLATQTGDTYAFELSADGLPPGVYNSFEFGTNGEIIVTYSNGKTQQVGTVGMATVTSPDSLRVLSGTVYQYTEASGSLIYGTPGDGTFGSLVSNTLEDSNADIATELTDMIESQRNYTANSKVFQTGSDLMEVITNLR